MKTQLTKDEYDLRSSFAKKLVVVQLRVRSMPSERQLTKRPSIGANWQDMGLCRTRSLHSGACWMRLRV